jgi:hypothetical protein
MFFGEKEIAKMKDFSSISVDPTESDIAPLKSDFAGKSDLRGLQIWFCRDY